MEQRWHEVAKEGRPAHGTPCWVYDGRSVFYAKADNCAAGGWSNEDTWEDWHSEVVVWWPLVRPCYQRG